MTSAHEIDEPGPAERSEECGSCGLRLVHVHGPNAGGVLCAFCDRDEIEDIDRRNSSDGCWSPSPRRFTDQRCVSCGDPADQLISERWCGSCFDAWGQRERDTQDVLDELRAAPCGEHLRGLAAEFAASAPLLTHAHEQQALLLVSRLLHVLSRDVVTTHQETEG